MMAGEVLTDRELRDQLIRYGLNPGPILPTTRLLWERKLMQALQAEGRVPPSSLSTSSSATYANGHGESANVTNNISGVIRTETGHDQFNGNDVNGHDADGHGADDNYVPSTQQQRPGTYNDSVSSSSTAAHNEQQQQQQQLQNLYSQARQDLSSINSVLDGPNSKFAANEDDFTPQSGFIAASGSSQRPTLLGQTGEYGGRRPQQQASQPFQQPSPVSYSHGPPATSTVRQPINRPSTYGSQFSSSSTASSAVNDYNVIPSPFGRRPIKQRTMHDTSGNSFYLESNQPSSSSSASQTGREASNQTVVDGGRQKAAPAAAEHRSALGPLMKLLMVCLLGILVAGVFYIYRTGMYAPYFDQASKLIADRSKKLGVEDDPIVKLKQRMGMGGGGGKNADDDQNLPGA